jgi:hypothetical protein
LIRDCVLSSTWPSATLWDFIFWALTSPMPGRNHLAQAPVPHTLTLTMARRGTFSSDRVRMWRYYWQKNSEEWCWLTIVNKSQVCASNQNRDTA